MRPINMKSGFLIIEIIICFLFMIYYMSIQASLVFLRKKDCYKNQQESSHNFIKEKAYPYISSPNTVMHRIKEIFESIISHSYILCLINASGMENEYSPIQSLFSTVRLYHIGIA